MRTIGALIVTVLVLASCAQPDPVPEPTTSTTPTAMGDMDGMDHMDGGLEHAEDHEHDEGTLEWDGGPVPEISLEVTGDNEDGWTVATSISNFTLTEMSATEHVPGEGHAHIWVDGQVFTMVSQETTVIPHLDPGTHEIMVTLSSNTHLDYVLGGDRLMARTTVDVAGDEADHPVILVTITGGEVAVDPTDPEVGIGEDVELRITADVTDSVHVHGYDVLGSLEPGIETIVRFTADIPGVFEVELESAGTKVFDLTVR